MPNTLLSDCQLGQRLASQYGIDTVQSLVSKSRWGSELGVARMRYELPHLFVLAPLPTEDAFLLSVEINSGGSRRIVRDGDSRQLGLQQEGAFHNSCSLKFVTISFAHTGSSRVSATASPPRAQAGIC